jgi:DNA-binding MarR family transcriptional regulator
MCSGMCYSAGMSRRSDDDLAREWHDLMGRYHRLTCQLDRELEAEHGLCGSDFEVLQLLHDAGGECSVRMHDLAQQVHLTQSALSRLVARLEKDGLVERSMCADDRRSVFTTITPLGRDRYEQARPTQRRILREARAAADASA